MARNVGAQEPHVISQPDESSPLDLYALTGSNILAMMVEGGRHSEESKTGGEMVEDDHSLVATLPLDHSVVDQSGHMDHRSKPIVSIHGKDVDEYKDAA